MQLLRKILWPFSILYAAGVQIRNWTYDLRLRQSLKFETPLISVGNLSVGGTGKTPMIEWLIRNLKDQNRVAVLSRGYKRKTSGFVMADNLSTAEDIGDEPLQIYTKFPSVTVAVDGNRRRGITILEEQKNPELILMDDAFQHRKVAPDFSILLTAHDKIYTDDWYLPSGTLRDLKSQAKRADVIVVTKCPEELDEKSMNIFRERLAARSNQPVLFCALEYSDVIRGVKIDQHLNTLKGRELTLVTGIANPKPLINHLKKHNIDVNHIGFRDHHQFTNKELEHLKSKSLVLTTEKDFVRGLKSLENVAYLEIKHKFLGEGKKELLNELLSSIG